METLRICFSNIKFSNTLLETLKVLQIFLRTVLRQFQQQIFNWKYLQKFNWKYWENIFANTVGWVNFNRSSHSIHFPPLCFCHRQIWWQICWQHCIYHQTIYIIFQLWFQWDYTTIDFCDHSYFGLYHKYPCYRFYFLFWLQKNFI